MCDAESVHTIVHEKGRVPQVESPVAGPQSPGRPMTGDGRPLVFI